MIYLEAERQSLENCDAQKLEAAVDALRAEEEAKLAELQKKLQKKLLEAHLAVILKIPIPRHLLEALNKTLRQVRDGYKHQMLLKKPKEKQMLRVKQVMKLVI